MDHTFCMILGQYILNFSDSTQVVKDDLGNIFSMRAKQHECYCFSKVKFKSICSRSFKFLQV